MSAVQWKAPDPIVLKAREIVCSQMHDRDKGPGSFCAFVEAGLRDDSPEMRIAIEALKAGSNDPIVARATEISSHGAAGEAANGP